jgi:hypothetical protein
MGAMPALALDLGDRVENFRLNNHAGGSDELYYFADAKAVVLMAHNSRCEQVAQSAKGLQALQQSASGWRRSFAAQL